MRRTTIQLAAFIFAFAVTAAAAAQEPADRESVEELRREVTELRKLVAELTKRLDAMEYQRLPRATDAPPAAPARGFILGPGEPAGSKLRFPLDIERGTAVPVPQPKRLTPPPYNDLDRKPLPPRR